MSTSRSLWKKAFTASQQFKVQNIVCRNVLLDLNPQSVSVLTNNIRKRNAHFTFNPDPTDTTKGKN